MAENPFYNTPMGRRYYEVTMPELVRQLSRLNDNLEKQNDPRPAQEAIDGIISALYHDADGKHNPDKQWSPDTLEEIAGIIGNYTKKG